MRVSIILFLIIGFLQAEEVIRTEPLIIQTQLNSKQDENQHYVVYRVSAFGLNIGEAYFSAKEGKIEVRGQTYKKFRFIYSYDFFFVDQGDYMALYEKEKDKERVYQNEEIYEKKPWLPIISMFFKGNISDDKILNMKIQINNAPVVIKKTEDEYQKIFYFLPVESKIKKISVYIKKGESLPYRIDIEGKTDISLERVTQP